MTTERASSSAPDLRSGEDIDPSDPAREQSRQRFIRDRARDPAPLWEQLRDAHDPSLEGFERTPRFSLDAWIRETDEKLDAAINATHGTTFELTEIAERFSGALGPDASHVEVEVIGTLALLLWGADKRGSQETRIRREERKHAPFPGVIQAVDFWLYDDKRVGTGPVNFNVAENRDEDVRARARAQSRGRALPVLSDGKRARGYLPVDFMPAKQSRNGSTGGARCEGAAILRADVHRAILASGVGAIDLEMFIARDVGGWRKVKVPGSKKTKNVFLKIRAIDIAERFNAKLGADLTSAEAIGKRIGRTRNAIALQLDLRGLIPNRTRSKSYGEVDEAQVKAAKPKRQKKQRPAPLEPETCAEVLA